MIREDVAAVLERLRGVPGTVHSRSEKLRGALRSRAQAQRRAAHGRSHRAESSVVAVYLGGGDTAGDRIKIS